MSLLSDDEQELGASSVELKSGKRMRTRQYKEADDDDDESGSDESEAESEDDYQESEDSDDDSDVDGDDDSDDESADESDEDSEENDSRWPARRSVRLAEAASRKRSPRATRSRRPLKPAAKDDDSEDDSGNADGNSDDDDDDHREENPSSSSFDDDGDDDVVEEVKEELPVLSIEEVHSTVQATWEMLSIVHFFVTFEAALQLGDICFSFEQITNAWRRPRATVYVNKLHARLLKMAGETTTLSNWYRGFQKRWQMESSQYVPVISTAPQVTGTLSTAADYADLDLMQKVLVLKTLVDWVAGTNDAIRETATSDVSQSFLGTDNTNKRYWLWDAVLYKENRAPDSPAKSSSAIPSSSSSSSSSSPSASPSSSSSSSSSSTSATQASSTAQSMTPAQSSSTAPSRGKATSASKRGGAGRGSGGKPTGAGSLLAWLVPDASSGGGATSPVPAVVPAADVPYRWELVDVSTLAQAEGLLQEVPRSAGNLNLRSKIQKVVIKPLMDAEKERREYDERKQKLHTQQGIDLGNILDTKRARRTRQTQGSGSD